LSNTKARRFHFENQNRKAPGFHVLFHPDYAKIVNKIKIPILHYPPFKPSYLRIVKKNVEMKVRTILE